MAMYSSRRQDSGSDEAHKSNISNGIKPYILRPSFRVICSIPKRLLSDCPIRSLIRSTTAASPLGLTSLATAIEGHLAECLNAVVDLRGSMPNLNFTDGATGGTTVIARCSSNTPKVWAILADDLRLEHSGVARPGFLVNLLATIQWLDPLKAVLTNPETTDFCPFCKKVAGFVVAALLESINTAKNFLAVDLVNGSSDISSRSGGIKSSILHSPPEFN